MSDLDRVFPPEQSDDEIGDAYEKRGASGVFALEKERRDAALTVYNENHVAVDVASAFGCSPGDLYCAEFDPLDPAAMAAYYMGQTT